MEVFVTSLLQPAAQRATAAAEEPTLLRLLLPKETSVRELKQHAILASPELHEAQQTETRLRWCNALHGSPAALFTQARALTAGPPPPPTLAPRSLLDTLPPRAFAAAGAGAAPAPRSRII